MGWSAKCHQFAVVKDLKFTDPTKRLSFDQNEADKLCINDGGLSLDDGHIVYSMNKHKRWLLADIIKQEVEQIHCEAILGSEQHFRSTKRCGKKARNDGHQEQTLRINVVERCANNNIQKRHPDCIGVTSSSPANTNSLESRKKPRKKYAFVGDIKSKCGSYIAAELCYEFLEPFPDKRWPVNRDLGQLTDDYIHGDSIRLNSKRKKK